MQDLKTEQFLTNGGWKWSYQKKIRFADIDLKASQDNPARAFIRLDDDRALSYSLAMENGADFPAIVLLLLDPKASSFKYLIATGVHRWRANDILGRTETDAYVVTEADRYRADVLTRQLNTIEGQGMSVRDKAIQVIYLAETYNRPLRAIAKEWNVKYDTVQTIANEQKAIKRAREFGIEFSKYHKLSQKSMLLINSIPADPVYRKTLNFVLLNNSTSVEIENIVREIKATRDEASALAVVDRHIQDVHERTIQAKAKHGRISASGAHKFTLAGRRLAHTLEGGIEELHFAAYPSRLMARVLCQDLIGSLKTVIEEIDRIERLEAQAPRLKSVNE